jgi:hypothetical protein
MKPDATPDPAAPPEFEETMPWPFRVVSLVTSGYFVLVGLIAGIVWNPLAFGLLLLAAGGAANRWGNYHVRGSAGRLDLQVRIGRLPVWWASIQYSTIQESEVCPAPLIVNPFRTVRFGRPLWMGRAVKLQLTRPPLSTPRPADVVYVGTAKPEELVAFLRTRIAPAQERPAVRAVRMHYAHREFCPICLPFGVGTIALVLLLMLVRSASPFPNELINILLGIGVWAFGTATLCTSYLQVRHDHTDLVVSYGPLPFVRARLPYRQMVSAERDWLDFFRIVWGALPGKPRCFVGRGGEAVRVTLSVRRADLGHSREVVIGTNDAEGLVRFLKARIAGWAADGPDKD